MKTKFDYRALGRLPAGTLNKTEAAYAAHLELLKASGDIKYWKFEPSSFRLAPKTFYKPDFLIVRKDDLAIFDEVKGFMTDDANVKIKTAADMFPFLFRIVRKKGSFWTYQNVGSDEAEAA